MRWADPWVLVLIPFLAALFWNQLRQARRRPPAVGYSDLGLVDWSRAARPSWEGHIPAALSALGMLLVVLALARPQLGLGTQSITSRGIDIMLCIDTSSSMQAQDLQPDRLAAAKKVSEAFVAARPNDRIGVVVFARVAFTQCPLTIDHSALQSMLEAIKPMYEMLGPNTDGTAIGTAIATCVNRLKDVPGKSRVVILLTDGCNNAGAIGPIKAARLAKQFGIRIYTIGVGTRGDAPITLRGPGGFVRHGYIHADVDDQTLTEVAQATGGRYFRATDNDSLHKIYHQIDRMEKSTMPKQEVTRYRELFAWFLVPGILLLTLSLVLGQTVLREVP